MKIPFNKKEITAGVVILIVMLLVFFSNCMPAENSGSLWSMMLAARNNGCEDNLSGDADELTVYPVIRPPAENEYIVVDSIRNFEASSGAFDIINHEGKIVWTIYDPVNFALNKDKTKIFFKGWYDANCDENIPSLGILDFAGGSFLELRDYDWNLDSKPSLSWSSDENFLIVGQTDYENNILYVRVYNKDGGMYKEAKLSGANFSVYPCGSICLSPDVFFDEDSGVLRVYTQDGALNLDDEVEDVSQEYIFSLDGVLIGEGEILPESAGNSDCLEIEYHGGETSQFCVYN